MEFFWSRFCFPLEGEARCSSSLQRGHKVFMFNDRITSLSTSKAHEISLGSSSQASRDSVIGYSSRGGTKLAIKIIVCRGPRLFPHDLVLTYPRRKRQMWPAITGPSSCLYRQDTEAPPKNKSSKSTQRDWSQQR